MPDMPMQRGAALTLELMGGFCARDAQGRDVAINSRKAQALLAVLALSPGRPQKREKIAALLWSDRAEPQARASLRQALAELRRVLPDRDPPLLAAGRDSLYVDANAIAVDAVEMLRLIDAESPDALATAADFYRGDLLDGLAVHDPAFEEWLQVERTRLRDRAAEALRRLLERQSGAEAMATARRLLALDPLDEATHRTLIRLYAEAGDRTTAIKQYESCREVLDAELGLRPEAATEQLIERIRRRDTDGDSPTPPLVSGKDLRNAMAKTVESGMPSIAVLPFANLSGDPQQEYFADGLTTDVITELGRFREFRVVSRFSSQFYRPADTDPIALGQTLAVDFLLRGSVRRLGEHLRVSAHLLDAASGSQIWAERYDRQVGGVFDIEDEIVRNVVATLAGRLRDVGERRAARKAPRDLSAYDCVLRGRRLRVTNNPDDVESARSLLLEAIRIDPRYAAAYAELAMTYIGEYESLWTEDPAVAGARALDYARKAVALDDSDSLSYLALACGHFYIEHDCKAAKVQLDRAVELNPNDYECLCWRGWLMTCMGEVDDAVVCANRAITLNPLAPVDCLSTQGLVAYLGGRYDEAIAILTKVVDGQYGTDPILAASYAQAGRKAAAQESVRNYMAEAEKKIPTSRGRSRANWGEVLSRKYPLQDPRAREHFFAGLRMAGLPL